MRISFILMAMLQVPPPVISIVDSKDDSKTSFVMIDNCKVAVKKTELKDFDAVVEKVSRICGLDLSQ